MTATFGYFCGLAVGFALVWFLQWIDTRKSKKKAGEHVPQKAKEDSYEQLLKKRAHLLDIERIASDFGLTKVNQLKYSLAAGRSYESKEFTTEDLRRLKTLYGAPVGRSKYWWQVSSEFGNEHDQDWNDWRAN